MRALSNGDLGVEIPHQGERTEIGSIADTLQLFKQALIAKRAADETALANSDAQIQDRIGWTESQAILNP